MSAGKCRIQDSVPPGGKDSGKFAGGLACSCPESCFLMDVFEAQQKLSELVERASQGEEIVITCRGKERTRLAGVAVKSWRSVKVPGQSTTPFHELLLALPCSLDYHCSQGGNGKWSLFESCHT